MERCPNCGVETRPGDQFCLNCGNRLAVAQPVAANPWQNQAPPPGQNQEWYGGQGQVTAPTAPTLATVQSTTTEGAGPPSLTVANTEPTLATIATVGPSNEPTVVAPPETLERTAPAPIMSPTNGSNEATSGTGYKTQRAMEESEPTITSLNTAPAKLIVTRNGQAREFLLKKADISIGRAPSNEVALSGDQLASRRHALIRFDGFNYTIRDVGSANGTYVNGVELRSPTPLRNGDHISIGEHEAVFFTSANEETEPPTITITPPLESPSATFATAPVPGQGERSQVSAWSTQSDHGQPDQRDSGGIEGILVEEAVVQVTRTESGETRVAEEVEDVEINEPTITVSPPVEPTYRTELAQEEQLPTVTESPIEPTRQAEPLAAELEPTIGGVPLSEAPEIPEATIIERVVITSETPVVVTPEETAADEEIPEPDEPKDRIDVAPINEEDMPLPVPQLPDTDKILTAITSLDSTTAQMREHLQKTRALEEQAQQLRDQLKTASDMISTHDNAVAVLAQRLRVGVADVSNRLNKVVEEVTRADQALSIEEMMKLIEDVRNDPRDIYTVGSLARRARELAQFFELHQHVNKILSECLATLNELLAVDPRQSES